MKIRPIFLITLFVILWASAMGPLYVHNAHAQQTLTVPTVYISSLLTLGWTAGVTNNGGHPVTIAAGTGSATANQTDCSAPNFSLCNFVYANSSGTVAITTTPATAFGSGNSLLAAVETGATTVTQIVYPWQMFSVYGGSFPVVRGVSANLGIAGTSAGNLILSNATSGSVTIAPPTGALGAATLTVPALTGSLPTGYTCGASLAAGGTCTNTALAGTFHMHMGSALLAGSTSAITGFSPAYTSATSWWCVANDITTRANPVQMIPSSGTAATITNTTGATDLIHFVCMGN